MSIGKKIKTIRILKGVEVKEISKFLEISPQAYGKIERDETNISLNKLELIANYLKTDVDFIKNFEETFIFSNIQNSKGQVGFNNQFHLSESNTEIVISLKEIVVLLKDALVQNNNLIEALIKLLKK